MILGGQNVNSDDGWFNRINPSESACVLIGVDDYTRLDSLRGVRRNLVELHDVLTDRQIWGIPEDRITTIANPNAPADLVGAIREAATQAVDTLIVYYAGHGLLDRHDRQLLLALPDSAEDQSETCVRTSDVRRAIQSTGSARRRVLILDCCFSGQVMTEMSDTDGEARSKAVATLRDVEGSYVMASAPRDRPSHAPDPRQCTVFTGALTDVMRQGVPDGPRMLGLHALFEAVKARIAATRPEIAQQPQDEDHNGVGALGFVRNVAVLPPLASTVDPQPPASRGGKIRWALLAGALGVVVGLGVTPAMEFWRHAYAEPAEGKCSSRAELLDHSDDLNTAAPDYVELGGLSALSLVSEDPTEALALADNEPGLVFPVTLGSATDLRLSADTPFTLLRPDKTRFNWLDGEALVVEKGEKTILVGDETGPAIRRFDVESGRQIGESFPVPDDLKYWPEGSARVGRSIESLTASLDGRYLYAGWEGPLSQDGDTRGRNILRIQRYKGSPGGRYVPDKQYAYLAGDGLNLVELVAVGGERLLGLERQYVAGLGNAIQVVELSLEEAKDVTGRGALYQMSSKSFAKREVLFDLADCPAGGPGVVDEVGNGQSNPLLGNVEGMALGDEWGQGRHQGWRPLYLVSDDNSSHLQITRVYSLAVKLST